VPIPPAIASEVFESFVLVLFAVLYYDLSPSSTPTILFILHDTLLMLIMRIITHRITLGVLSRGYEGNVNQCGLEFLSPGTGSIKIVKFT